MKSSPGQWFRVQTPESMGKARRHTSYYIQRHPATWGTQPGSSLGSGNLGFLPEQSPGTETEKNCDKIKIPAFNKKKKTVSETFFGHGVACPGSVFLEFFSYEKHLCV